MQVLYVCDFPILHVLAVLKMPNEIEMLQRKIISFPQNI